MAQILTAVFFSLVAFVSSCNEGQLLKQGVPSDMQKIIVDYHNELRNLIATGQVNTQPPAQNMRELRWDDHLAEQAQEWASTCVYEHGSKLQYRNRFSVGGLGIAVGQNLHKSWSAASDFLEKYDPKFPVKEWFDEVYKFGYNGTFSPPSGHYSQVIWGNTHKIGCGYAGYKGTNGLYSNYMVCNYFPGGNVRHSLPYEYGRVNCEENELFPSFTYSDMCNLNPEVIRQCYNKVAGAASSPIINEVQPIGETSSAEPEEPTATIDYTTLPTTTISNARMH